MAVTNPHDRFFKEVFSKKENAADLIRAFLPAEIRNKIALETLKRENKSFVNEQLSEFFSDLVYSCRYQGRQNIKISILLEHKSYLVKYPHLQLLKYLLGIWEDDLEHQSELSVVIPIVVYHGQVKWQARKFIDYFPPVDADLQPFIPSFDYIFRDLSTYSDEEIKDKLFNQVSVVVALGIMKHISDPQVLNQLLYDYFMLAKLYFEQEEGLRFLESVIHYLFYSSELNKETMIQTVQKISEQGGKTIMTIAEQLKQEGLKEGITKGIIKGKRDGILEGILEGKREGILEGILKGKREGILEGIELAVELKWGAAGLNLFEKRIKSITSLEKLQEIKEAIRIARDINELEKLL